MRVSNLLNSFNRKFFIYLSKNEKIKDYVMNSDFSNKIARRWIAGTTLEEAFDATKELNLESRLVSIDHLGEDITKSEEAYDYAQSYLDILWSVFTRKLNSNVSIKLTQMGIDIDEDLCYENLKGILRVAKAFDNFVRIDMEGSPHTQKTIDMFKRLRKDYDNVGIVLQSYLYRTENDMDDLLKIDTNFRLCKGAYREPANIAFPKKAHVNENYMNLSKKLLLSGRKHAYATHDENMIKLIQEFAYYNNVPRENVEFQMLYGVRRDLQQRLVDEGYNLRVYVPFGEDWYPYTMRRFAESYHNVWFILKDIFN